MSDIDVAALRAAAEAASAWNAGFGWTYVPGQIYVTAPSVVSSDPELDDPDCRDLYTVVQGTWEQDARHIAAFDPPTVLALLDRLAAAETAVERVRDLHDQDTSLLAAGAWCPACGDNEPCRTKQALSEEPS